MFVNVETAFNDLGINAIVGTNMMDLLGLTPTDFHSPIRFARFREVLNYLKQFPDDTQRFIINKAVRGKNVDKLDHVFEYTNLLQEKFHNEERLENINKEISVLEATGDPKIELTRREKDEIDHRIDTLAQEISIYEK